MLTEISIKNLPTPERGQKTYADTAVPGFGVRVSQGGTKTYVLVYGKNRTRVTIAKVGIIKLADARAEARRILAEHTLGKHRPKQVTFTDTLPRFIAERYKDARRSTRYEVERLLTKHFTGLGKLQDITTDDLTRRIHRIEKPSEELHAYRAMRTFMRWCVRKRLIEHNPLFPVDPPSKDTVRDRVLSEDELAAIWDACDGIFGLIVQMLYITAQRRSQIARLRWEYVSEDVITWPAEVMKGKREQILPITTLQASKLASGRVYELDWVFPSKTFGTAFNGFSAAKRHLDKRSGVSNWRLHDLRRTAATRMARHTEPHILQMILAHAAGPITPIQGIYNRYAYIDEKRAALERHENDLLTIIHQGYARIT